MSVKPLRLHFPAPPRPTSNCRHANFEILSKDRVAEPYVDLDLGPRYRPGVNVRQPIGDFEAPWSPPPAQYNNRALDPRPRVRPRQD
jgi:hypothetical protein